MAKLKWKLIGLGLMGLGAFLFVMAVRDIAGESAQTAVGLTSVFCASFGFGLILLPLDSEEGLATDSPQEIHDDSRDA